MRFVFSRLFLPEPFSFQPNNLIELANKLGDSSIFHPLKTLENLPIQARNIDEILTDILQDQADRVSRLEWVYCLQNKAQWDLEHPDLDISTSEAIWKIAANKSWLSRILLWRLALYHGGSDEAVLAPKLAECFPVFVSHSKNHKPLTVYILKVLEKEQSDHKLAKFAYKHLVTPKNVLKQANLPYLIPVTKKALALTTQQFCSTNSPNEKQVEWLIRCLNQMLEEQQVSAVNYLLTQVPTKVGGSFPRLVDWWRRYYGPRVTGERWHQLSEQAKRALREWIGAINYGDFANLVDKLLEVLPLKNWQENQLLGRKEFWANYSNRFERIRILLPQTSVNALDPTVFSTDIEVLAVDGAEPTEICIFDFGDWFVVEFFRGPGSETRLFNRNPQIEQRLFGSSSLSIRQLRHLGGELHDHCFLWQFYCRKWLQNKGIHPNPGTRFRKAPTEKETREREWKLERWRREIDEL